MLSAHRRSSTYQLYSLWFYSTWTRSHEEFEDTKGIIRIREWSKEKVQKDKQRSTKHIHKTIDRVTMEIGTNE